ncbi:MAG TPA: hypothetical protein VE570_04145 [Thermoleophilaceae bacterium]|jgi:hypothetical protein|nr:hypothetical protein [Thermoleophilaceae bacterium]
MRTLVRDLAISRVLAGSAMLLKPEATARGWIGARAASHGGTKAITRACGARDLALGAGALAKLLSGGDARDWIVAGAFADLGDLVATATADDIPLAGRLLVLGLAGSAIAVSAGYVASAG